MHFIRVKSFWLFLNIIEMILIINKYAGDNKYII